ncbi:nitrile hydratase subunit beta [Enterovirga rhinocerotis]|uniref:Nitrile hydratase subunit beta n=1 Tax=Enterovirga rhinocerotis TaxID=1339210 RepID=A0A4R7C6W0_9HYPH|nr:nitrile hydratase subunit beta [Enterovirga rhinocerotis]TDR92975.1 nitrile hydratase [Enterovirga rhinocerotis]
MDGMHDLGGKQGFGRVDQERAKYKETWEPRVRALQAYGVNSKIFNMDEFRHAIERMAPMHYMTAPYFERHLTSVATLLVEKGLTTAEDLKQAVGGDYPLALPLGPGRMASENPPQFKIGDKVRVKDEFVSGHHRMPGYLRGKTGEIVAYGPITHFPDAAAHNMQAAMEATYDVRFRSSDIWNGACDESYNYAQLFQSYMEPASGA